MGMELGNTGLNFNNAHNPKWIQFNSEISIRKGDEGWIINARIDNWSNTLETSFDYMLTTYKYEDNEWKIDGEPKLWMDPTKMNGNPSILSVGSGQAPVTIHIHNKKLMIKNPEATWFSGSDWVSQSQDTNARIKKPIETKSWSGVWIDDANAGKDSWIFENIELYMDNKKYSQMFCKGEEGACFQSDEQGGSIKKPSKSDTWSDATKSNSHGGKIKDVIPTTVRKIIDKLKDLKGSWAKLEDICDTKIDETPSEEHQQQLRIYCSKGKAN